MQHIPIKRIRNTPLGSTVLLPGVKRSMYLGERNEDGFAYLWPSKECKEYGLRWMVMATGSHPVEIVQ